MAIEAQCAACGAKFRAKEAHRGKHVACLACGQPMVVDGAPVPEHEVFISYSKHDKQVADAVCATLEARRLRCWIAPRDILTGEDWGGAIVDAIEKSRTMVLVFSAESNKSPQVLREVERAVSKGVTVVPLRIESAVPSKGMEYYISASHWLDALTPPLEQHLRQLANDLEALLGRTTHRPVPMTANRDKAPGAARPFLGRWRTKAILAGVAVVVAVAAAIFLPRLRDRSPKEPSADNRSVAGGAEHALGAPAPARPSTAPESPKLPPVTLSDVIPVKADAEMTMKRVSGLDPGQNVGTDLQKALLVKRVADAMFAANDYRRAKSAYEDFLAQGQALESLDATRKTALDARTAMEVARVASTKASGEQEAKEPWALAEQDRRLAEQLLEKRDFTGATTKWRSAATSYSKSKVEADARVRMKAARAAYESDLAKYDRRLLESFAGLAWERIRASLTSAETAERDRRLDDATADYRQAQSLLPAAETAIMPLKIRHWSLQLGYQYRNFSENRKSINTLFDNLKLSRKALDEDHATDDPKNTSLWPSADYVAGQVQTAHGDRVKSDFWIGWHTADLVKNSGRWLYITSAIGACRQIAQQTEEAGYSPDLAKTLKEVGETMKKFSPQIEGDTMKKEDWAELKKVEAPISQLRDKLLDPYSAMEVMSTRKPPATSQPAATQPALSPF